MKEPTSLVARRKMQMASVFAGLAISQTRTALAHSISYPLTVHYGVPHGLACSFTLPNIISYYLQTNPNSKYEDLMISTSKLISSFNLFDSILNYVSHEQILALSSEMFYPDRLDNFSIKISNFNKLLSQ